MKTHLIIILVAVALQSCVSHTTIHANKVTVNTTTSPTLSLKASGLPLSLP